MQGQDLAWAFDSCHAGAGLTFGINFQWPGHHLHPPKRAAGGQPGNVRSWVCGAVGILLAGELGVGRAPFASPAGAWAAMGTLPSPLPCGGELSSVAAMGARLVA